MIFHISWLHRISFTYKPTASFFRHKIKFFLMLLSVQPVLLLCLKDYKTMEREVYNWRYFNCNWINLIIIHAPSPRIMIIVNYISWFCFCFKLYFNISFNLLKKFSIDDTSDDDTLNFFFASLFGYQFRYCLLNLNYENYFYRFQKICKK